MLNMLNMLMYVISDNILQRIMIIVMLICDDIMGNVRLQITQRMVHYCKIVDISLWKHRYIMISTTQIMILLHLEFHYGNYGNHGNHSNYGDHTVITR